MSMRHSSLWKRKTSRNSREISACSRATTMSLMTKSQSHPRRTRFLGFTCSIYSHITRSRSITLRSNSFLKNISTMISISKSQFLLKHTSYRDLTRRFWHSNKTFPLHLTISSSTNSLMQSDTKLQDQLSALMIASNLQTCKRCSWLMTRQSWWNSLSKTNRWTRSRSLIGLCGRLEETDYTSWRRRRKWRTFLAFAWSQLRWSTPLS